MDTPDNAAAELTVAEIAAVRRVVSAFRGTLEDGHMLLDDVPCLFAELGFTASRDLIVAMASEYVPEGTEAVTVPTLLSMTADWKVMVRMQLRNMPETVTAEDLKRLTGRNLLVADEWWRTSWSFFVMLCGLAHWILVFERDIDAGLERAPITGFVVTSWLFTIVYALDMALWFRTLRIVREGVIDDAAESAHIYLRSAWFWIDVASMVPLDVILSLAGAETASGVVNHLRLLRYARSSVFFTRTFEFNLSPQRVLIFFQALPLWFLAYILAGIVTLFAFFFALITNAGRCMPSVSYLQATYFVVQTFTTVGYGDRTLQPCNTSQQWFGIFLVYCGLLTNAVGIGRLVTQLQRDNAYSTREDKLRETLAVLKYFHIPPDLQTEILSYQEHVLWNDTANAYFHETGMLPQAMRDTMLLQTRVDVLSHVPYLREAPASAMAQLATALIATAVKPEEYISFSGDPHAGVRFVLFGFVVRFDSRGHYVKTLRAGDFFGFEGIISREDEVHSHKALSYCDVWILPPSKLHDVFARFPRFFERFRECAPMSAADVEVVKSGSISTFPSADDPMQASEQATLLRSLKHLRWRLEQAAARKRGKNSTL